MPATYDALVTLSVGGNGPFPDERRLDAGLTDLEDRGLVGWDRTANRYDLHPTVRSVVWDRVDTARRRTIYAALQAYFGALPKVTDWKRVEAIEDLTATIEWYHALIGLERYDDAYLVFSEYLSNALLSRLSANRERAALREQLFPDGTEAPPHLQEPFAQTWPHRSGCTSACCPPGRQVEPEVGRGPGDLHPRERSRLRSVPRPTLRQPPDYLDSGG
jgi:hypothetical protein